MAASIVVLFVGEHDWTGYEPAYWIGGAAAGALGLTVCVTGFFCEFGVRQRKDRERGNHRVLGERRPLKQPWEQWDQLQAVDGHTETHGRYRVAR